MKVSLRLSQFVLKQGIVFFLFTCAAFGSGNLGKVAAVAISPDGNLVAAVWEKASGSFIYLIPVGTGKAVRLTNNTAGDDSSPAFSADGKRVIFTYSSPGSSHNEVVMTNVDGSGMQRLGPELFDVSSPVLSSDNDTIVFTRSGYFGNYSPIAQPHPHALRVYVSDLDGKNPRDLTNKTFYMVSPVSLSPDDKHIVLVTEELESDQRISVYAVEQPGRPIQSVQPHVKNSGHWYPIYACPNYLADGRSILFMTPSGRLKYDYDVYRLNLTTGATQKLTNRNGYANNLKVSRDGKTAVFLRWHSEISRIFLLEVESHKLTPLDVSGLE